MREKEYYIIKIDELLRGLSTKDIKELYTTLLSKERSKASWNLKKQ